MIFLLDKVKQELRISVYEDILDLTSRVEWQDVFEGKLLIIDESGTVYQWDSSREEEIGTVYRYSLIPTSRKSELIENCLRGYSLNRKSNEFMIQLV